MSEFRDTLVEVVSDRQSFTGDVATNGRTGESFIAEIEDVADIELNTQLGRDARESIIMHVLNDDEADGIRLGDIISVKLLGVVTRLRVLRRSNNPAAPLAEFGCMKIVNGIDT